MKITKKDLNNISSMAKQEYVDSQANGLDQIEHLSKCWLIAVSRFLQTGVTFEFPKDRRNEDV